MRKIKIFFLTIMLSAAVISVCVCKQETPYAMQAFSIQPVAYASPEPQAHASPPKASAGMSPSQEPAPVPTAEPQYASLLFAGDVMAHQKQIDCHKFGASYDFADDYIYIKEIISAADIAVVNLETPMSGKKPYTGYPHFNAPDSLADALVYAGFDVIATANNHIRDQKDDAMKRTCSLLKSKGLDVIGTASEEGDKKYLLVECNGIKIGFINFTKSLNRGFPEAAKPFVNCLQYKGSFDEGYLSLGSEISALKQQGADFIAVFVHWGSEYQLKGNQVQQDMAKNISDLGADLIIGAHPHVVQNVAEYTSPATGKDVLIYYSLGNLVSNQPYSYGPGSGYCETGALALIRLMRLDDGRVAIDSAGYLTTYVHKPNIVKDYTENGKAREKSTRAYYIVPAAATLETPHSCANAEGALLRRIMQGVKNGSNILGESGSMLALFDFQEYTEFPW